MTARTRGLIVFGGILFVTIVFCGLIPFVVMPGAGVAVALPVIQVPGEIVDPNFFLGVDLTNTIIGTVAADLILVLAIFLLWRATKGWTKEIPGRLQGLMEIIAEGLYNFFYGLAGDRLRTAPMLWPLVATIFIFLITANMLKLLPGVETVGKMHCAYAGTSGYYLTPGWTGNSYRLWVDEPLSAGFSQTAEEEDACNVWFKDKAYEPFAMEGPQDIQATAAAFAVILDELPETFTGEGGEVLEGDALHDAEDAAYEAALEAYLSGGDTDPTVVDVVEGTDFKEAHAYVDFAEVRIASAEAMDASTTRLEEIDAELDALSDGGSEEAETAEDGEAVTEEVIDVDEVRTALDTERESLEEAVGLARAQMTYPGATLPLSEDQMDNGVVPFKFHVTPFVRGAATDLSLTFALAVISMVLVQVYGVLALGPAYFDKFLNIPALGNLSKKPLGAIDFIVGLLEIIAEIGKVVSLAFRLFGNLFAGGVALMAVTFLVALFVPIVIYGLEVIIGTVQALVFAVLTLVFSVQAMEHHGDDHEHDAEHH